MLDDFHAPAQRLGHPSDEAPLIAAIDPDELQAGEGGIEAGQQRLSPLAIRLVGRVDACLQQEAERVDEKVAFAPGDLLAAIVAARPPFSVVLTD